MSKLISHEYKTIYDVQDEFFKIPKFTQYTMHYWYFNKIDLDNDKARSLIIARSKTGVYLNNEYFLLEPNNYAVVKCDFDRDTIDIKLEKIEVRDNRLRAGDFNFRIDNGQISTNMFSENFHSQKILDDTYEGKYLRLYRLININSRYNKTYLHAQNVVKHGPLMPWNWLHFYLEDGTYIKVFQPAVLNKWLRVDNDYFVLNKIAQEEDAITYYASKGDLYFQMSIDTGKPLTLRYKPKFSTTWEYQQYGPHLKHIETNIPGFNTEQKGRGVLEVAKGYSA